MVFHGQGSVEDAKPREMATWRRTKARTHPLRGLLVSQALGAFNDNAWKQIVIVLAAEAVIASDAALRETRTQEMNSFVQVIFMIPLLLFSLPAGVVADRFSKRSVILAMKGLELCLMLAATLALYFNPLGGVHRPRGTRTPRDSSGDLQSGQVWNPS